MPIETNEYNQIKFNYPQLYADGEYWIDYTTLMELSGQNSTTLFRLIKSLDNVPIYKYKNRCFYKTSWALLLWKWVGQRK